MIALFDSGVGGLNVLKTLTKRLPEHSFMYLADNARYPYGNYGKETLITYTRQAVRFLMEKGATTIVFACNTVCATALPVLEKEFAGKVRLIGIITPIVEFVAKQKDIRRIGVIATRATVHSGMYEKCFEKIDSKIEVISKACPLLVPLIEENFTQHAITKKVVRLYVRPLKDFALDALILGCTHYFALRESIQQTIGKRTIVPPIAERLADMLSDEISSDPDRSEAPISLFCTDPESYFYEIAQQVLGSHISKPHYIELSNT